MPDHGQLRRSVTRTSHHKSVPRPIKSKRSYGSLIAYVLFALFVAGGIYMGCVFVSSVASMLGIASVPVSVPRPVASATGSTASGGSGWKGTERVNILLLGLDQREDQKGMPTRSDTMILLTLDPLTKSAGMLSLPRDLWVPIPGHGENKINTSHFFGEMDQKGNGPILAMRTVQNLLDIPIHHYAVVDFEGFERLIDAIGGITVDVEKPIRDDEYPTPDYGTMSIYIPAGTQHMDGERALQYARSRHSDSDFGRIKRQRQVLLAARNQVLRLDIIPKLPSLLGILQQAIKTDLSPADILGLAMLAREIDGENVVSRGIEADMVNDVYGDGSILTLKRDELVKVMAEVFSDPRVRNESASIEVQNGTNRSGLAGATAASLKNLGYKVVRVSNASRSDYKESTIIDFKGKKATTASLAQLLEVSSKNIRSGSADSGVDVDILVILGENAKIP